jgi:hypothetical protein
MAIIAIKTAGGIQYWMWTPKMSNPSTRKFKAAPPEI